LVVCASVEREREHRLKEHRAAHQWIARVRVSVREVEIELREERPHVRDGVRELRSDLRDVILLGRASSRAGARLLGPGRCCERREHDPQRREAGATRERGADRRYSLTQAVSPR
jgi:hypothetical protein